MLRAYAIVAAVVLIPAIAHAQDAFEIQVYDSQGAARGEAGIELHLNQHVIDLATDETHLTFEPHYGLTDWAELGGYFQTAETATGDLAYAGVKLRLKLRRPERLWDGRIGLAINGELSAVPARFEPEVWGGEIRPIIDLTIGRLYAAINPILEGVKGDDPVGRAPGRCRRPSAARACCEAHGEAERARGDRRRGLRRLRADR